MRFSRFVTLIMIIAVMYGTVLAGQNNSLYQRYEEEQRIRDLNKVTQGSLSSNATLQKHANNTSSMSSLTQGTTPILKASWITVEEPIPKDFRVHDLVTIIIHEVSKHSTKADTETEREFSINAKIDDWIRLTGGNLRPDKQLRGDPKIKASVSRDFEGTAEVSREDSLTARIQAEIIDVLPNGNLLLEATHTIITDEDTTKISLTGMCRSKDMGIDNTIISSRIANLKVKKEHTGVAHDATKRGFMAKLLDFLNPF